MKNLTFVKGAFSLPASLLSRFLCILLPALLTIILIAWIIYSHETRNHIVLISQEEKVVVNTGGQIILDTIDPILSDLAFLTSLSENTYIRPYGDTLPQNAKSLLQYDFALFAASHPMYDQIRLLDNEGRERIRINSSADGPVIVSPDELQNKYLRYYFQDMMTLNPGEVFISPLDLNFEHGQIERPLKPMIRLGQVISAASGSRKYGVIINYKAHIMLDKLRNWAAAQTGDLMLLNSDGYWLHGRTPDEEWGFMLPGRDGSNFQKQHPKLWNQTINANESGQIFAADGIYTYATLRPIDREHVSSTGSNMAYGASSHSFSGNDYYWKIVSHVPTAVISITLEPILKKVIAATAGTAVILGLLLYFLVKAQLKRMQSETALRIAKENLEFKVNERTKELFARNRQLTEEINARIAMETALAGSEERYRSIMEAMDDGVYITSADYRIIYQNPALADRMGQDVAGRYCYQALYAREEPCPWCVLDRVTAGKSETYELESPMDQRIYHICNNPIRYHGDAIGKLTIFRDITDYRLTQQALAQSELKYSTLLEAMREGLVVVNAEGLVTYCNTQFGEMLGYSPGEITNRPSMKFLDKANAEIMKNQLAVRKTGTAQPYELAWRKKNGETLLTSVSPAVLLDERNEFIGSFGLVTDISAQRKAEEEKRSLENQLLQAQKMEALGTLAGGIAHDFNNILAAIVGYTELAYEEVKHDPKLSADLKEILTAGGRAAELVKQILAFARQSKQVKQPLEISPIIQEALKLIRSATPPAIEIDCEVKGDIGEILADPTQIHQIVMNLCTNACHAMSANGGRLNLTVERAKGDERGSDGTGGGNGDFVRLTVADTGHGIPQELVGKIFDPFFTTKEIGKGTGLGLSVVHSIVSDLEGHIQIKSVEGEGTTVEILLPISRQVAGHNAIISEKIYYGNGEHVIWLDDEEPLVTIGCHFLKSLGYQPKGFSCPEACLKALRDDPHAFKLIFTDFNMPKMNGLVLTKKIREINSDIPIILCSGFSEEVTADNAKARGLQDYLMKPARKHDIAMAAYKALKTAA